MSEPPEREESPELAVKHAAYEAALRRYHEAGRRGKRQEQWLAAAEADRARLEYYRARDALGLSPMTDPILMPAAPEQFTAAMRTPKERHSALATAFNVVMPFLLFLGVALPLLIYAFVSR